MPICQKHILLSVTTSLISELPAPRPKHQPAQLHMLRCHLKCTIQETTTCSSVMGIHCTVCIAFRWSWLVIVAHAVLGKEQIRCLKHLTLWKVCHSLYKGKDEYRGKGIHFKWGVLICGFSFRASFPIWCHADVFKTAPSTTTSQHSQWMARE